MNIFERMENRKTRAKTEEFIKSLNGLSEKDIEQKYLDNKEFENNEILLSHLFFEYPNLIRILPLEFQKNRVNSNLTMFKYASQNAKKEIVSSWLKENKLFMNALVVRLSEEDINGYIKLYFQQPEDVSKLFMDDLKKVINVLSISDLKETEKILDKISSNLTDRQWEYVIEVNPIFIKYASQTIQNKYAEDEKYSMYINGEARENYIKKQIDKIKEDPSLIDSMPLDVQKEFIITYPYMINYISEDILVEILKYDINLIKLVNITSLKDKEDKGQDVIYRLLENIENKTIPEIINLFIDKGVLNAKGKIYRFDKNSLNLSYQYTQRLIKIIQSLSNKQIISLIDIDVNYVIPYIIPVFNTTSDQNLKEKITIDSNKQCLSLFEEYYNDSKIYEEYYKVINKIYSLYINNMEKYNYEIDYDTIFDLFKLLFNKRIILNNPSNKIIKYIGFTLLYKDKETKESNKLSISMLNAILNNAYKTQIDNDLTLCELNTLEKFDPRLYFIDKKLLTEFCKYNFVNISTLLYIIKNDNNRKLFKFYYEILCSIYSNNKETLYRAVENFTYYKDILSDIDGKELDDKEITNLIDLFSSSCNYYNIKYRNQLENYDLFILKNLLKDLAAIKNESVYKNLICSYLFNKGFDEKGNGGWLDITTISQICDVFDIEDLENISVNGNNIFNKEEIALFGIIDLLFQDCDFEVLLEFIEGIFNSKVQRNIVATTEMFNKLKKYRCEIINSQIVNIKELEMLLIDSPDTINKKVINGVSVYTIFNKDFKVLCSYTDDGIHYACMDVSLLEKNCYGYNELVKNGSIRFTTFENHTLIKAAKDRRKTNSMKADYLIVIGKLTDDLIKIAYSNKIPIVEVKFN